MRNTARLLLLFIVLLCGQFCQGQTVVNSTGNTLRSTGYIFEYSIGEISITTLEDPSSSKAYFVTQGQLQPSIKIANPDCDIINDTLTYFPVPTRNILSLVGKYDWITGYHIFAADGKLVKSGTFISNQIDLATLAGGVYFIRLLPGCNGKFRTLKVIRQ